METDRMRFDRTGEKLQSAIDPPPDLPNDKMTIEAEFADMRDRWMRAEAEIANVRSRAKRDVDDAKRYAVQKFATDVVEAAENLRRGVESIPSASVSEPEIVGRLRDGFLSVERAFIDLLKRNGVVRVDPTGSAFDPAFHQAMSEVADGREPGTVLQALSAAWTLNGRLIRPAMVVVSKGFGSNAPASAPQT